MKLARETGRRGEPTITIDGRYLHSPYSPRTEAARFLETQTLSHSTRTVLVIGDGLGVIPALLTERLPDLRVISLEPVDRSENLEDFYAPRSTDRVAAGAARRTTIRAVLRRMIHPTEVGGTQLLLWPAIEQCSADWRLEIESGVRDAFRDLRSELATIGHFGRLWIANALRATLSVAERNEVEVQGDPIYLATSGPTIEQLPAGARPFAVSSALHFLRRRGELPLLVLHTDGGMWARRYLHDLDGRTETVLALPLRAGRPPVAAPLLLADGSIVDRLAPDALEWTKLPDHPSVGVSLLDLVRRIGGSSQIVIAGLDMCTRDLLLHARPHQNDRYIVQRARRVASEHSQRYARLAPDATTHRWEDGSRAFYGEALEALTGPLSSLLTGDERCTATPLVPSPVWSEYLADCISKPPTTAGTVTLDRRRLRRPDYAMRRGHAVATIARWREEIRSAHARPNQEIRDLLLYLAPVEYLTDLRNGGEEAGERATERLDRIAAKAGLA